MNNQKLGLADPQVAAAIGEELGRQRHKIELIASENFVSPAVMEAMGTVLTNKYAEGYPGHRYYGGCEYVDKVEELARQRACELFGAEHANVQPHCGANANLAAFFAFVQPGDTVMGMNLSEGGHLSHGSPVNISGKYFHIVPYGVDPETERIDYDKLEKIAEECRPKMIIGGASAYPRIIDFERMAAIAHKVGAFLMIDMAHIAGLVAAGLHPSPVPYADVVTTTTHKTLRGPRGGMILCPEKYAKQIDKAVFPGTQGGPLMHIIAAKAVALGEALKPEFKDYQKQIIKNAAALAEELTKQGLRLVFPAVRTTIWYWWIPGPKASPARTRNMLDAIGITCKNTIPNDPASPFVTSGIRLGAPAATTRGFLEENFREVARIIGLVLSNPGKEEAQKEAAARVAALCEKYPLYPNL